MVDPGVAQAIVKQLNRWYRKRAKPHGTLDLYHRGTRMRYTAACRSVNAFESSFLLSVATVLYFVPSVTEGKSSMVVLLLKLGWGALVALAVFMILQVFREYVVINDDGLLKSDLFGRETRMAWKDIFTYRIKPDDNKVIFHTNTKSKLTMSLSYDGWQDFLEMAARHLNPTLYWQFNCTIANIDAKRPILRSTKKPRWAKWFSSGRTS